jgi:uncharacterized protein YjbI with pentapeptide repeats
VTTTRACGHALALVLIGAVTVFINASSAERPLRRYDAALRPLLQTDNPYLLTGMDLRPGSMGAAMPLGQIQGQDLSGMDLRKAIFSGRGLRGVRLRGSHLAQADFSCVPLEALDDNTRVDLSGADLRETRFDFSGCPTPLPPGRTACPQEMKLPGNTSPSCFTLEADLVGANLSGALLQGKPRASREAMARGESPRVNPMVDPCERWLVIRGKLDGARFEQATLRCVALINRSASPKGAASPAAAAAAADGVRPAFAGIRFVQSDLDHLLLQGGNFLFSDFWKARVSHLMVNLSEANLRFSSLAQWDCPGKECVVQVIPAEEQAAAAAARGLLALNVSGSRIRSNLPLASRAEHWPALLCDDGTTWTPLPTDSTQTAAATLNCSGGRLVRPGPVP